MFRGNEEDLYKCGFQSNFFVATKDMDIEAKEEQATSHAFWARGDRRFLTTMRKACRRLDSPA